jgi:hypothetical protein
MGIHDLKSEHGSGVLPGVSDEPRQKPLFAQLIDFLPWKTFGRIVARYDGDSRVRTFSCSEQYRATAFAQRTYRESLRDIETCLSVQASKLYHMGFSEPARRSTLADANGARDWRIYAELAQRLIAQARKLCAKRDLGPDLANTVYVLDSTTIDLCLSVFPWAPFRTTKAAVKMHTLLDLRGNIPSFIHLSDGNWLMSTPWIRWSRNQAPFMSWIAAPLISLGFMRCSSWAFFVTRAKSDFKAHRDAIRHRRIGRPVSFVTRPSPWMAITPSSIIRSICAASASGTSRPARSWYFYERLRSVGVSHRRPLPKQVASGAIFQMDQAAPSDQAVLSDLGKRGQDPDMDRCVGLCARGDRQKAAPPGRAALRIDAGPFGDSIRENFDPDGIIVGGIQMPYCNRK